MILQYNDHEFMSYLNRHLTGIILLKNNIKKISVSYYLSEAYARYACRFHIEVDFIDFNIFTENEKALANKYLYNSWNSTGSQFVSFIYKNNSSRSFDLEIIKSFIYHYEFAQNIFDGFIKTILPKSCNLEISSLDEDVFFNYIDDFLCSIHDKSEVMNFNQIYYNKSNRHFDFDLVFHKILQEAAQKERSSGNIIKDTEINEVGGGNPEVIRQFVIDQKLIFSIPLYSNVINEIFIDIPSLKKALSTYIPSDYYSEQIRPERILQLLEKKEAEKKKQEMIRTKIIQESNLQIGDYIYIRESYGTNYFIGKVKALDINYTQSLQIKYALLKKDWTESKRQLKEGKIGQVRFILKPEIVEKEIEEGNIRWKGQFQLLFKNKGVKNLIYKD